MPPQNQRRLPGARVEAATEASANGPDPASSRGPAPNGPARERPDREGPGPERPDEAEAAAGIVVSATELGQYADWRFCPRCAWVRRQVKQLPFQGFPGIFSSIDRYNKLIVRNHFERESRPPIGCRHWAKSKNISARPTGLASRPRTPTPASPCGARPTLSSG